MLIYQKNFTTKSAASIGKICDADEAVAMGDDNSSDVIQEVTKLKSMHN